MRRKRKLVPKYSACHSALSQGLVAHESVLHTWSLMDCCIQTESQSHHTPYSGKLCNVACKINKTHYCPFPGPKLRLDLSGGSISWTQYSRSPWGRNYCSP